MNINIEQILLIILIVFLLYFLMNNCSCNIEGLQCPITKVDACVAHESNCNTLFTEGDASGFHTCKQGGLFNAYRCISSGTDCKIKNPCGYFPEYNKCLGGINILKVPATMEDLNVTPYSTWINDKDNDAIVKSWCYFPYGEGPSPILNSLIEGIQNFGSELDLDSEISRKQYMQIKTQLSIIIRENYPEDEALEIINSSPEEILSGDTINLLNDLKDQKRVSTIDNTPYARLLYNTGVFDIMSVTHISYGGQSTVSAKIYEGEYFNKMKEMWDHLGIATLTGVTLLHEDSSFGYKYQITLGGGTRRGAARLFDYSGDYYDYDGEWWMVAYNSISPYIEFILTKPAKL